jgi:predicted NBD/HSP70 family sugar kinase
LVPCPLPDERWDCSSYLDDQTGVRLAEEILRRLRLATDTLKHRPDVVALSMPGTLEGDTTVARSTRLGILEPLNITALFAERGLRPVYVLHDTECLALGEARFGALQDDPAIRQGDETFAFIYAHEGIGSTLYHGGRPFRGAGNAGRIGRLVVAPDGPYNRTFMSRGSLEIFAARPWVSTNLVGLYLAERGKAGEGLVGDRTFRSWLSAEAEADWSGLTFQQIALGIRSNDPLAVAVMEEAARYLGLAVHALVTVAHPPAIILGGGMVTDLPGFFEAVTSHARRFSYEMAWNSTTIRRATLGEEAQTRGAAELVVRLSSRGGRT